MCHHMWFYLETMAERNANICPHKLRIHIITYPNHSLFSITQKGSLFEVLSHGHRCKQRPSAVSQFPLQSRVSVTNSVYNKFTGVLGVVLSAGKTYRVASSREINQCNPCVTHHSPPSTHQIRDGLDVLLAPQMQNVPNNSAVGNSPESSGGSRHVSDDNDENIVREIQEHSQTSERAVVPHQSTTFPVSVHQQGVPAGASRDITADMFRPTTVVSTSYHLHLNGGRQMQNGWNGPVNSLPESVMGNETDPSKSYEIPTSDITVHNLRTVSNYLQLPIRYKPLGELLGFKEHEIEGILYQNHNNVCHASFTLLLDWKNQTGTDLDAWSKLFNALKQVVPVKQMEELHQKLMKS